MSEGLNIPSVPHLVHIETTYRCNGRCVFCYNPRRGEGFCKEKIDRIVLSIYNSWVPHVYLIGGEPSLLGVEQLNEYINFLSVRSSVTIVTNGLICLEGLSIKLACVGVPIHGNEETHERHTTKKHGYKRTIRAIEYYVDQGFDVRCIPVLTAWNFDQMYEVIKTAKQLGMESVFVDRFEKGGLGCEQSEELEVSSEQFKIALGQMIKARDDFGIPVGFGTAIPYCLDERLISENMFANCGAGITFAAVNPDGDVRVCNQSEIVYGNVLNESLDEIWAKKELSTFRDLSWVTEPCISCPVLKDCLCGCKVDCTNSSGFCVDYSIRGKKVPPVPVSKISEEELSATYPKDYRVFVADPYTKLNNVHKESWLVTRYQTIELDSNAEMILQRILEGEFREENLVEMFSADIEEEDVRGFITKLLLIGAIQIVDKIDTLECLYREMDDIFGELTCFCDVCEYFRCLGYIWLLPQESEVLCDNGIEVLEINGNISFINSLPETDGEVDISVIKPSCRWCKDKKCTIHEVRPITCRMYPLSFTQEDGTIYLVLNLDCEIAQRVKEDKNFINSAIAHFNNIDPDLFGLILDTFSAAESVLRYPDGKNRYMKLAVLR